MKRLLSFGLTAALVCSNMTVFAAPVQALESTTMTDHQQQMQELNANAFPDPDASYTTVTENDLVFHVYNEYAALAECTNREVTAVTIPAEIEGVPVAGITGTPFGYCRNLTSITLPDTFQYMAWFDLCCTTVVRLGSTEEPLPSVSEVIIADTNPFFTVSDGLVYSKDMKTLVGCPPASDIKELKISDQTEIIGDYAFAACMELETAIIPSHIQHIHNNAFVACINLTRADVPESITAITGEMFCYCLSLTDVTFRGEIQTIGFGAFNTCEALTDFEIPDTVTYIGANAFTNSGCIENVDGIHYVQNWVVGSDEDVKKGILRDGTVGIAEMAFMGRSSMNVLDIPQSAVHLGDVCFAGLSIGVPSVIYHRSNYIGERTLAAAKTATDIYIYDPACVIFDSETAIPAVYRYTPVASDDLDDKSTEPSVPDQSLKEKVEGFFQNLHQNTNSASAKAVAAVFDEPEYCTGDIVIHGYADSTAQAYAEKYNRKFELIEEAVYVPGDVNSDGVLNLADAVLLQKWLLSVPDVQLTDWKAADLDQNGRLDVHDLSLMKQVILKTNK